MFGRKFIYETLSVIDCLASSAILEMGEGAEQTPLAVITDVPFVTFIKRNLSKAEIYKLKIAPEDDLYGPFLTSVKWKKGKKG